MNVRFLADENLNREIVVGLLRLGRDIDIVRVQDVGLRTAEDPGVLSWAAAEGRALVTHDIATIPDFAHERVIAGLPMPGVFLVRTALPIGAVMDDLALLAEASEPGEWEGRVIYLPLR
ncbi:MAG: DUF5615 family PIN-like protein [Micropruina sp.]